MLGYLCGYYRYYHPLEYITAFLNNAANDDDIQNGTALAHVYDIKVENPKWGISRSNYYYDSEKRTIAKGVASIKYMSDELADEMYRLAHNKEYEHFVDVLIDLNAKTSINTRQLEILIKIDFFSMFGNQRELLRLADLFYDKFKRGAVKQISRTLIDGTRFEQAFRRYAVSITKAGLPAKKYTITDEANMHRLLHACEKLILSAGIEDLSLLDKARNFKEAMGYVGYVTNEEADKRKLYIVDERPLKRKSDGKLFGHSVITKSIGSGKEARFTILNRYYNKEPIYKDDIIQLLDYRKDGQYWQMTSYRKLVF